MDESKGSASLPKNLPRKRGSERLPQVLSDRITLSESIEAVGRIVSCYPNGGSNADKAYIGALAFALSRYPPVIAEPVLTRAAEL